MRPRHDEQKYQYGRWRAGFVCAACRAPLTGDQMLRNSGVCPKCGYRDKVESSTAKHIKTSVQEVWYLWRIHPLKRLRQHLWSGPVLVWSGATGPHAVVSSWGGVPQECHLYSSAITAEEEACKMAMKSTQYGEQEVRSMLRSHDSVAEGDYCVTLLSVGTISYD